MKKTIRNVALIGMLCIAAAGCTKENKCDVGCYSWGGGYIMYKETIGHDFGSALDSLQKVKYFNSIYNKPHYLEPEQMSDVDYPYNDRLFYMIKVMDSTTGYILATPVDALDTKGCWYVILWPED